MIVNAGQDQDSSEALDFPVNIAEIICNLGSIVSSDILLFAFYVAAFYPIYYDSYNHFVVKASAFPFKILSARDCYITSCQHYITAHEQTQ